MDKHSRPTNVPAYISAAPAAARGKLRELRTIIRSVAPDAEERISYGMPYYAYHGRLVYFRLSRHHIGLYIPTPVIQLHAARLKAYDTTKATLRIPLDAKIPVAIVRTLVRARMRMNEAGPPS